MSSDVELFRLRMIFVGDNPTNWTTLGNQIVEQGRFVVLHLAWNSTSGAASSARQEFVQTFL